jgi:quercetin dioxygenase-like cupin family protein
MPDDLLDALTAAPKHHKLLFENEYVRVLDTTVGPGETVPMHTHEWQSVLYVQSWSDFVRRDEAGVIVLDWRGREPVAAGTALWSPALAAHTLENVGESELRAICVELKTEGVVVPTHPPQ